ncbi:NADH dehydrogenase [ubiquinone] 1 beta subcomplex subunit 10-B [Platanthera guangdongensis]|uniref:NADH dehydrogenase [ubiquinone] 1 beta subcomplex subunit 10-B n=1 Tax=Platanthera guangdongensis TaxID=2320717 RepID=A0ABR2LP76_9ASPA
MGRKKTVEFDEGPPDNFDPNNPYADPVAMLEHREYLVREKWIQIETAKIIRERLKWCYRIEGVNHLQKCRHLVEQYLEATRGVGWGKSNRPAEFHGLFRSLNFHHYLLNHLILLRLCYPDRSDL